MKVKALSRSQASTQRECSGDLRKNFRNLDPKSHPMQRAREYQRAVSAVKIDRMFAKPFITSLGNGHNDSITASATSRSNLAPFVSGSADGVIKVWDIPSKCNVKTIRGGHNRIITGLTFSLDGTKFYSCSDDGLVRLWSIHSSSIGGNNSNNDSNNNTPLETYRISGSFKSIDQHWSDSNKYVTASDESVAIWDASRNTSPIQTYSDLWNSDDTVNVVRYNPAECNLVGNCSMDRGIGLFDTRSGVALRKTIMSMKCNCLEWNPMEPMNFVVGNEDYNAYEFDMRKLDQPKRIHKGHQGAIMCLSWSPTGSEFVTGSYDKTIRIFNTRKNNNSSNVVGTSRDIYHTKRMQRIFTVHYTLDSKYILSGSDDTNIRLWKSNASSSTKQLSSREESSIAYRQTLIKKYQHLPEIKRISSSRKVPKLIKKQTAIQHIQKESAARKHNNRVKHSKPGTVQHVNEKQKSVVKNID